MSYPNWKEPSTAVKTVKTKVLVTCGEWNTGLGNTRQFQLPSPHLSAAWTSDRLHWLVLAPWYSFTVCPMLLAGLTHMSLWAPFISPTLLKQQTSGTASSRGGTRHPFPYIYMCIFSFKLQNQDCELELLLTKGHCQDKNSFLFVVVFFLKNNFKIKF